MVTIPLQLRKENLRFYLIGPDSKIPIEKGWTTDNNYRFDSPILKAHEGNYGVVCGKGNLVVLDFDSQQYLDTVKHKIPDTFQVITAGKRLPHYYFFIDEDAPKKIGVNVGKDRVCDIQALGSGVVGPGSSINRRFYEPNEKEIAHITMVQIGYIFDLEKEDVREYKEPKNIKKYDKNDMNITAGVLAVAGVEVKFEGNMKCPFHDMQGKGNLSILPNGSLFCFHCLRHWWPDQFVQDKMGMGWKDANKIVDYVRILYEDRI